MLKCQLFHYVPLVCETGHINFNCIQHIEGERNTDGKETDMAANLCIDDLINMDEPIEPWCKWLAIRVLEGNYSLIHAEQESPYRPKLGFF